MLHMISQGGFGASWSLSFAVDRGNAESNYASEDERLLQGPKEKVRSFERQTLIVALIFYIYLPQLT